MREQLISFETAYLAKKKRFDIEQEFYYDENNKKYLLKDLYLDNIQRSKPLNYYNAPTQSLLQKWIREKHNINIMISDFIDSETGIEWDYEIVEIGIDIDENGHYTPLIAYSTDDPNRKFKTYEKALEIGLLKSLELIKI